jgi:hypothetical protein
MQRRHLLAALGATASLDPFSATAATGFKALPAVRALRLADGLYADGFLNAPGGYLNWYFANLGLWPFVGRMPATVRRYLACYLAHCDPVDWRIRDALFSFDTGVPVFTGTQASDSDDSYAATFLSLVVRYVRVSGDGAWWQQHLPQLKQLAWHNLGLSVKPGSGLVRVFQDAQRSDIAYLMDNCEVWRGLTDFAQLLRQQADPDAAAWQALADGVRRGVRGLFSRGDGMFLPSDDLQHPGTAFYPDGTAQVFPQAFGVLDGGTLTDAAWQALNQGWPGWAQGGYDPYPWMVLGWCAALRDEVALARAQQAMMVARFASDRGLVTINELGFHERIRQRLG